MFQMKKVALFSPITCRSQIILTIYFYCHTFLICQLGWVSLTAEWNTHFWRNEFLLTLSTKRACVCVNAFYTCKHFCMMQLPKLHTHLSSFITETQCADAYAYTMYYGLARTSLLPTCPFCLFSSHAQKYNVSRAPPIAHIFLRFFSLTHRWAIIDGWCVSAATTCL